MPASGRASASRGGWHWANRIPLTGNQNRRDFAMSEAAAHPELTQPYAITVPLVVVTFVSQRMSA